MRPDPHKQKATRRYIQKQREKGVVIISRSSQQQSTHPVPPKVAAKKKLRNLPSNEWRYEHESEDEATEAAENSTRKLVENMKNMNTGISRYTQLNDDYGGSESRGSLMALDLQRLDDLLRTRALQERINIDSKYLELSPMFTREMEGLHSSHKKATGKKAVTSIAVSPAVDQRVNISDKQSEIPAEEKHKTEEPLQPPPPVDQNVKPAPKTTEELEEWLDDLLQ